MWWAATHFYAFWGKHSDNLDKLAALWGANEPHVIRRQSYKGKKPQVHQSTLVFLLSILCYIMPCFCVGCTRTRDRAATVRVSCPEVEGISLPIDCCTSLGLLMLFCITTESRNTDTKIRTQALQCLRDLEQGKGLTFELRLLPDNVVLALAVNNSMVHDQSWNMAVDKMNFQKRCLLQAV